MTSTVQLKQVLELSLGSPVGMLRAFPVHLDGEKAICAVYSADFDIDPYTEMFFFPTDTLKLALFTTDGQIRWRRDLGPGVIPGIWFVPFYPFDLDQDGTDDIWFVHNLNEKHPLSVRESVLERIDGKTGQTIDQYPWVYEEQQQPISQLFRNFIAGGYVNGRPVLVTAQGTYGSMYLQGWNADMTLRWKAEIPRDVPGARGSHMCPVIDVNGDGVDEIFWGERCIELDRGTELFCADRDHYRGHSDVIQPIVHPGSGEISIWTVRESDGQVQPRVAMFDAEGNRAWGDVDTGHMDMGWSARLHDDQSHIVMAIRIGQKTCGPDGRYHQDMDEFTYDALTGHPVPLPYSVYRTVPVDMNGDGYHELVRGIPGGDGEVFDRLGHSFGHVGGTVAMASKFMNLPGEQILCFYPDGTIRIWADEHAADSDAAKARYVHPFYAASQRLTGVGYNLCLMAGL
ncbi:hypothetical protein DVH26_31825 [Paenibacillus sp. H1-7]|uniref:rhamnogalacturonan lyase family protein n=1 Tax=Paenibacillus sp. H1-7 TaxID=2282849 RepID=UPI001EF823BA|nr:hypothetical protein [Paenibacillus sp. H1-7]ULL18640.1 hypothetical protein DVH26_31825 [Paenibacillus sp. H1-7]